MENQDKNGISKDLTQMEWEKLRNWFDKELPGFFKFQSESIILRRATPSFPYCGKERRKIESRLASLWELRNLKQAHSCFCRSKGFLKLWKKLKQYESNPGEIASTLQTIEVAVNIANSLKVSPANFFFVQPKRGDIYVDNHFCVECKAIVEIMPRKQQMEIKEGGGTYTPTLTPNKVQTLIGEAAARCVQCSITKMLLVKIFHAELISDMKSSVDLGSFDAAVFYEREYERETVQDWKELYNKPTYKAFIISRYPPARLESQIFACFPKDSLKPVFC